MIALLKHSLVIVCAGILVASCSSKAKKSQEVQETIRRMNEEHEAQRHKQQTESEITEELVSAQRADGIAARVNEEVILLSDLEEAAPNLYQGIPDQASYSETGQELQEARRVVLERLIEKKLLEQEAEKRNYKISDEEVEKTIDGIVQERGLTKEEFLVQLAGERMTIEQLRERIRRELGVYRLLDLEINRRLHVSDEQCRQYYEEHREEFTTGTEGEGFRIQQIVLLAPVGMSSEEKDEKRLLIEQLHERILSGEDFGAMAVEFSEGPNAQKGGDCGFFEKGELLEELDSTASKLEVGELSPVLETAIGYHLIKVTERVAGEDRPLEAVESEIRSRLRQETYQKEFSKLIESLKETAYIDVRL